MDGNIATFSEFARMLGVKPSAVTALKNADRLVLTVDGKHLLVAESQQRMRDTSDPSKAGVVERHAAARTARQGEGADAAQDDDDEPVDEAGDAATGEVGRYQSSRARREHYLALSAQRDYELEIGKLMVAADVVATVSSTLTVLRTTLERLPDVLGPQLAAETDEGRVRAVLVDAIEHALEDTARQFASLAKREDA
ncbi:hypothetical protein [Dyella sp.]|uniref:hypothetical protein n=1 Tax=Dyella sp. TaxID=1869338 RepID=UPI0028497B54|nr:hypothetical protein [Dyella sp.]MDR3444709.1 hypothetical protein [Dyella sp.]